MLLDSLKNFFWLNEPANVRFVEEGMLVETLPETDFWQSKHHRFYKDNGHFFYTRKQGDCRFTVKWQIGDVLASDQCGIMIRIDDQNWAKAGLLTTDLRQPQLGSVVTVAGVSDWASWPLDNLPRELWCRLVKKDKDILLFASIDGTNFRQIRMFTIPKIVDEFKIGAFACSPLKHSLSCILEDIG